MLQIKRVLGAEKCYELLDGRKVPFKDLEKLVDSEIINNQVNEKKVTKKRTRRRKKTDEFGS
jgi:hypothetical protein